jgi:hypothetical protein
MVKTLCSARGALISLFSALILAGCGGGDGTAAPASGASGGSGPSGTGTLRVALTDAPACGYDHVYITVDRVRVHTLPTATEADSGWSEVVLNPAQRIDLLALTNGVLAELGQAPLPAGHYTQVRLVLRPNGGGSPANAIVPSMSGVEIPLDTPSAAQSGLKLIHPFTVQPNSRSDLLLDFDACRSVVRRGRSGRYNLKPVIAVIPRSTTAIAGVVDPALGGVTVSAQKNGKVVRSTTPNAIGNFLLSGLDDAQSPFEVVFTADGHATAVIEAVPVTPGEATAVSTTATPVALPPSPMGSVRGAVQPLDIGAAVRAVQAVGGVPKVEVGHDNVDALAGDYSLKLPLEAARHAAYSTTLPLAFTPDATAAAYTLEAFATDYVTQTKDVTVGAMELVNDFTLVLAP